MDTAEVSVSALCDTGCMLTAHCFVALGRCRGTRNAAVGISIAASRAPLPLSRPPRDMLSSHSPAPRGTHPISTPTSPPLAPAARGCPLPPPPGRHRSDYRAVQSWHVRHQVRPLPREHLHSSHWSCYMHCLPQWQVECPRLHINHQLVAMPHAL